MADTFNLTKIIATIGPATSTPGKIKDLIKEGVAVFRINFSHGNTEDYTSMLSTVRRIASQMNLPVAVLGDLPGPKIRIGDLPEEGILLRKDNTVVISDQDFPATSGTAITLTVNHPEVLDEINKGERILIDDGNVRLVCKGKEIHQGKVNILAEVISGGVISSRKGINLPDTDLTLPSLTSRDKELIRFAVEKNFDFLALSFVREPEDIKALKKLLQELGVRPTEPAYRSDFQADNTILEGTYKGFIPIISKIEKPQAVRNLEGILRETDMVMVARGDLGVEMELAEVAIIQKNIIRSCREYGVPVIVATQMLQSMIENPTPTRAEVSDVANAIFDGADAVMLSGETAIGKYPVETVHLMNQVAHSTNEHIRKSGFSFDVPGKMKELRYRSAALANGVKTMVEETDIDIIGVWSELGGSAVFLSQCRIPLPIYAFTPDENTMRLLSILYGVQPMKMEKPSNNHEFINQADAVLLEKKIVRKGETAIYISREPISQVGFTNQVNLHYISDEE
jgi:pyruvate kinase